MSRYHHGLFHSSAPVKGLEYLYDFYKHNSTDVFNKICLTIIYEKEVLYKINKLIV